jgi:hypothetical protein
MQQVRRIIPVLLALAGAGCMSSSVSQRPFFQRPESVSHENEIVLTPSPAGPAAYGRLFDKVFAVVSEDFVIARSAREDGIIETEPRIAPGLEQPWKPGSPNLYERSEATCQTYRHRCFVLIRPEGQNSYRVMVTIFKELEDLPKPSRDPSAGAIFRSDANVERVAQVIDEASASPTWIPKGRDYPYEQKILRKIEREMQPR